jgi:hypothetical protein
MERQRTEATLTAFACTPLLPFARNGHSLLRDPAGKRIILFGGAAGIGREFSDTWELRLDSARCCRFNEVHPQGIVPPARWGHTAVLRDTGREMVVFGGSNSGRVLCDVWTLGLSPAAEGWRVRETSGIGPAPRNGATAVYHPGRDAMIVFGGEGTEPLRDTWELQFGSMNWRRLAVRGPVPEASIECAAAYDAADDRMLVVTGRGKDLFASEVWSLDLSNDRASWCKLMPGGAPPEPRAGGAFVFDSRSRLLFAFGGWSYPPMVFHDDLHVLDIESLSWRRPDVEGARPAGRRLSAMSLDSESGDLVLFGGENQWRAYVGDVWFMAMQPES